MKLISILLCLFLVLTTACAQELEDLIAEIEKTNEVQYEHIGFAGEESEQYKNFETLKRNADLATLLQLLEHENPVVSCYAGWALIDQAYSDLPSIFAQYLKADRSVMTFSGCIKSRDSLSNEFYHRYWNKTTNKKTDPVLQSLDSLILYQDQPDWLLLTRALENRVYEKTYNSRIAYLAFEQGYREAIFYLSNWYKAEYLEAIRSALLRYLQETNFIKVGTSAYYETVAELLKFKEEELQALVIEKLRADRHWEHDQERFRFLFDQYSIYESDF